MGCGSDRSWRGPLGVAQRKIPARVAGHGELGCTSTRFITTINRVTEDLGEDEDWLRDVANEMEIEDGAIWVYGVGEHGSQAFTDFGIESLIELVRMYKESPKLLKRCPPE
ncbi:hypothetical protein SAMN05444171_1109 [Bradyrhizobium lablabi]|uniref:Uncharacterized protein n=2 Tax=Bradyrhizobium TaxID=374 RepID=A0ABY0Q7M9_9BRAD|nr:hypothetical protein SAMN05444163_6051 [Bradyrhizobium ottawaense]SEC30899.1 hypothetical protein SAMN05444171_1109 [Bradyrhizobium lablabi]